MKLCEKLKLTKICHKCFWLKDELILLEIFKYYYNNNSGSFKPLYLPIWAVVVAQLAEKALGFESRLWPFLSLDLFTLFNALKR